MNGCIPWGGYRQEGGAGYGERTVEGKRWLAHRYAWHSQKGPIPAGMCVCHRCNNKGCINVAHLYLATNHQNILDAVRDGLYYSYNSDKTQCTKCGGPYSFNGAGRRVCKACRNKSNRLSKRRRLHAAMRPEQPEGAKRPTDRPQDAQ